MSDSAQIVLSDEFREAWAHYRHIEQARTQHVAFYFALLGALLTLGADKLAPEAGTAVGSPDTDFRMLALLGAGILAGVAAALTLVVVRRAGWTLEGYEQILRDIRRLRTPNGPPVLEGATFDIRETETLKRVPRSFSVHRAYVLAVAVSAACVDLAVVAGAWGLWRSGWSALRLGIIGALMFVVLAGQLFSLLRSPSSTQGDPHAPSP